MHGVQMLDASAVCLSLASGSSKEQHPHTLQVLLDAAMLNLPLAFRPATLQGGEAERHAMSAS